MTGEDTIIDAPLRPSVWRGELIETIKLAGPLALTQLGQIAMMTIDLALIGRLGNNAVAAAALAHGVLFTAFMFGLGLVAAVAPLAAQAFGARQPRMVRRSLRVGLWVAVFVGAPLSLVQLKAGDLLIWLGQPPDVAALAQRYLLGLAWSLTPAWLFIALRSFMSALNRPEPALWITLVAVPANGFLAYALIYGAFGLPPLDLLGAGIATTLHRHRHVHRLRVDFLHASAIQEISNSRALLACGLAAAREADGDRIADFSNVSARARSVRRGRAVDGTDRHSRARSSPDCAADGRDRVHGPARNRHGRDGAGRPRGRAGATRPRHAVPGSPQWRSGWRFRPRWRYA